MDRCKYGSMDVTECLIYMTLSNAQMTQKRCKCVGDDSDSSIIYRGVVVLERLALSYIKVVKLSCMVE